MQTWLKYKAIKNIKISISNFQNNNIVAKLDAAFSEIDKAKN